MPVVIPLVLLLGRALDAPAPSGGVVAPLAGHILWTGAMLALPPRVAGVEGDG
jgi:hypothetical protein